MEIAVRQAGPADARRIAELHCEGWEVFRSFVPPAVMAARTVQKREREWQEFLAGEHPCSWTAVAEVGGQVVGFASSRLLDQPEAGARSEVKNLYVAESMRGRGVGRRLLADSARWLAERGGEPLSLYSFTANPYRGAYERLGGEEIGERPTSWDGVVVPETGYLWPSADVLVRACSPG